MVCLHALLTVGICHIEHMLDRLLLIVPPVTEAVADSLFPQELLHIDGALLNEVLIAGDDVRRREIIGGEIFF